MGEFVKVFTLVLLEDIGFKHLISKRYPLFHCVFIDVKLSKLPAGLDAPSIQSTMSFFFWPLSLQL